MHRVTRAVGMGFTLAESLVGMVLAGMIAIMLVTVCVRQGAAGTAALLRAAARSQWADSRGVLAGDLAALSQGAGRLLIADDTLIELDAHVGAALLCKPTTGGSAALTVTALGLTGLVVADGWTRAIASGDSVLAFDPAQGLWVGGVLVDAQPGLCPPGPLGGVGRTLTVAALGASLSLPIGAPVQLRRRVRWSAYRAADGRWYLGLRERAGHAWATVQPVAGPLDTRGGRPLPFSLADATGQPISTPGGWATAAQLEVRLAMLGDSPADRVPLVAALRRRP